MKHAAATKEADRAAAQAKAEVARLTADGERSGRERESVEASAMRRRAADADAERLAVRHEAVAGGRVAVSS